MAVPLSTVTVTLAGLTLTVAFTWRVVGAVLAACVLLDEVELLLLLVINTSATTTPATASAPISRPNRRPVRERRRSGPTRRLGARARTGRLGAAAAALGLLGSPSAGAA